MRSLTKTHLSARPHSCPVSLSPRRVSHSGFLRRHPVRATSQASGASLENSTSYGKLKEVYDYLQSLPPSERPDASNEILTTLNSLKQDGALKKFGKRLEDGLERRNVFMGELRRVGVKVPDSIGKLSVRNDAAFLITVVGTTSVVAVAAGFLPGDWGFFVPYLTGGISIAVLGIGSTAPGFLQFFIDKFAQIFPDYRERVLRHEAAHLLAGYVMGVPVTGYSLDIGKAHTDFAEAKLQRRLIEKRLDETEVDQLALVAMAGASAEAMKYDEVLGQNADMSDLQRIMLRSTNKMDDARQQNMTRWAVYECCKLLADYSAEYEALQAAMKSGSSVADCIRAIELTGSS